MELNHRVVLPGTGFDAALPALGAALLTVVAAEPDAGLEPA